MFRQGLSPRALYEPALEECEKLFDQLVSVDKWEEQGQAMCGIEVRFFALHSISL